jgi:hypothetical protein
MYVCRAVTRIFTSAFARVGELQIEHSIPDFVAYGKLKRLGTSDVEASQCVVRHNA